MGDLQRIARWAAGGCLAYLVAIVAGQIVLYWATARAHPALKTTANRILVTRAEMHVMGVRPDPISLALLEHIPWTHWLVPAAAFAYLPLARTLRWYQYPLSAERLTGPSFLDFVSLRTMLIDQTIAALSPTQLVILGSGMDTRALAPNCPAQRRFEVDYGPTQVAKQEMVRAAGVVDERVVFVPVDFNSGESWLAALEAKGFDKQAKTVFVWEGVSYYLEPKGVDATLALVRECAPGSVIVFDYFTKELVAGEIYRFVSLILRCVYGEPLLCGIGTMADDESPRAWVDAHGLRLRDILRAGQKGTRFGGVLSAEVV